jgi:hypothetical protein
MAIHSLRLEEFSDRDILFLIAESADDEGWVSTLALSRVLDLDHDRPTQCVGARLAWLRRYGAVRFREHKGESQWQLTDIGYALMRGDLLFKEQRILESMSEGQMLALMRYTARRAMQSSETTRHLVRREFRHSTYVPKPEATEAVAA